MRQQKEKQSPRRFPVFFLAFFFLSPFFACNSGGENSIFSKEVVNLGAFQKVLYEQLKPIDSTAEGFQKNLFDDEGNCTAFAYQLGDYRPFWFDESGMNAAGKDFVSELSSLQLEGLKLEEYDWAEIQRVTSLDMGKKELTTDSFCAFDLLLTKNYLRAAKNLLLGTGGETPKNWHLPNDSLFDGAQYLAARAAKDSDFPSFDAFRPQLELYKLMLAEIHFWKKLSTDSAYLTAKSQLEVGSDSLLLFVLKKEMPKGHGEGEGNERTRLLREYQRIHNLEVSGKASASTMKSLKNTPDYYVDYIRESLLRLQLIPRDLGPEYVWVNIAFMKMAYMKGDQAVFHCNAIVGTSDRKTPSLSADLTNIVFNPPWTVPPTIIKKDVGSGVQRSGVAYLHRKGLRAYDKNGQDVTSSVNSGNFQQFTYRQPPGAQNALGKVKFNMENPWHIYLHDTPNKAAFSRRQRAMSSGCVRLECAKDFAFFLLDGQMDTQKFEDLYQSSTTKSVRLERPVPVYIIYLTIAKDTESDQLVYLNPIYS